MSPPSPPDPPSPASPATLGDRLAHLTPKQRELLLRQLALRGAAAGGAVAPVVAEAIARRAAPAEPLPLSPAQRRIWFFERLQPGTGAYHVYGHYRLRGALDVAALERAFAEIVRRHESLRTSFEEIAGEARQAVAPAVDFAIARVDLRSLPAAEREAAARRAADEETERPFDLSRPPLLRATLVQVGREEHVLLVVLHHIVADAWSRGVLYGELTALYGAFTAGRPSPLPEPAIQFPDVVLWQRDEELERRVVGQLGYWREALAGVAGVLDLPTDRPRSPVPALRGGRHLICLPQALVAALAELARREGATLFMALLAAFQTLLARLSGQDEVVVGSPIANRGRSELEPLIGLFVNTLALRGDLAGDPSFRQLLSRTRSLCLDAFEHGEAPLERIVDELALARVPGRTPLFQVMFVLQNAEDGEPVFPGISATWLEPDARTARFELTLSLGPTANGLEGVLDYDRDLFEPATVARLADALDVLLRGALADPDRPISRLPLLAPHERDELLRLGDGGEVEGAPSGSACCLHELVASQAARSPDVVAIVEPGRELTYEGLIGRANGLAHRLRALGVGPESRVAVLTDRSAESIVGVLGVLAAGGAYVPLDPSHPAERLVYLLADASARALVVPPALLARASEVAAELPIVATDDAAPAPQPPPSGVTPEGAAYVIYTSGSTGAPKGVVVEHRGAVNLVQGFLRRHEFSGLRLLMIPPLVFDASVGDLFPALACGAALVLHPSPSELAPRELERFCREHQVTGIDAPAALWRHWSESWSARPGDVLPSLRLMMIGGESVPVEQVRRFARATGGRVVLCNHYGPTEASVCAALWSTTDGSTIDGSGAAFAELPIGRPLPGVHAYVIDRHFELAPRGVVGELAIGGLGVARGYLGQPAQTAERFQLDPFAAEPGSRLYRTGDLVRWNADGTLQFLGRRDQQVKLRGFRIELGEIEAAMGEYPGVRAAVAMVREDRPGDRRLVAYVVADEGTDLALLRTHLESRLPPAMLPAAFVRLGALPLTTNGKVDRRALPAPAAEVGADRPRRTPTTDTERGVLAVWAAVLGRDDLSVDDDFFAVGGDSLATLPLVFKLQEELGVELPLATVFAAPTIAALAREIDARRSGAGEASVDLEAEVELPAEVDPRAAELPLASRAEPASVLVTGATGFLGAFLLRELLDRTSAEVLCLVRAADDAEGLQRVRANLESYGLWRAGDERRLVPVPGDLAAPELGLSAADFAALARRADLVVHNGGQVSFVAPYERLAATNVLGTREVLRLATSGRLKPVHLVSTLGLYLTPRYLGTTVRESDDPPAAAGQTGGYNQSKWVGERLALEARRRGLPVAIYRPARITGASDTGASNLGDYLNAWIRGCVQLGLAPRLPEEAFDMAPVDFVSRAIVRLALGAGDANGAFHFFNPHRLPIAEAVAALRAAGLGLREVDYGEWRAALLAATAASRDNALAPFAGLFPERPDAREPAFDCSATNRAVEPFGIVCPPADRRLFATYLHSLQARGFLPAAVSAEVPA